MLQPHNIDVIYQNTYRLIYSFDTTDIVPGLIFSNTHAKICFFAMRFQAFKQIYIKYT